MEKNCFAMKTNGIRWRSSKMDEPSLVFMAFHGQCQKKSILIEKHRNLADLMTHSLPPALGAFLSKLSRQNGGNRHECLRNMFRL